MLCQCQMLMLYVKWDIDFQQKRSVRDLCCVTAQYTSGRNHSVTLVTLAEIFAGLLGCSYHAWGILGAASFLCSYRYFKIAWVACAVFLASCYCEYR